jgi:hypothetical protein
MNVRQKVEKALKTLTIPSAYQNYLEPPETYITFFEYDREYEKSDDEIIVKEYTIQVDLWTKDPKYIPLVQQIIEAMNQEDFILDDEEDLYERDTKIYHKALRFIIENLKEVE